jgi:N-acyl homoserine lactone hydrolase
MGRLVYRQAASGDQPCRRLRAAYRHLLLVAGLALCTASCERADLSAVTDGDGGLRAALQSGPRLYVLDCGRIEILDLGLFDRGGAYAGRQALAVDPCFLIRHADGDLLWDTGIDDALNASPDGLLGNGMRFLMPRTLTSQLTELGLRAGDIDYLALSHSHFDHVGNARLFASATWLVDESEREYMFRDEARADPTRFPLYSALENAKTTTFRNDLDVFGDGSVMIVQTPGHTPGHTSLLIQLEHTGPILLSGDLYHFAEARQKRTIPTFNTDPQQTLRSMDLFEALRDSTDARVVIQHEPEDFAGLPKSPNFLD